MFLFQWVSEKPLLQRPRQPLEPSLPDTHQHSWPQVHPEVPSSAQASCTGSLPQGRCAVRVGLAGCLVIPGHSNDGGGGGTWPPDVQTWGWGRRTRKWLNSALRDFSNNSPWNPSSASLRLWPFQHLLPRLRGQQPCICHLELFTAMLPQPSYRPGPQDHTDPAWVTYLPTPWPPLGKTPTPELSILAQGGSPAQAHHTLFSCCQQQIQAKQHVTSTRHLTSAKKKITQNRSRGHPGHLEIYKTSLPYAVPLLTSHDSQALKQSQ